MESVRVLFWLPAIFLASYLAVGAVFALLVWLWPWGYAVIAAVIGAVLLAVRVS